MKLATLKDGKLAAIRSNNAIPLTAVGFNGDMKDLIIESGKSFTLLNDLGEKILETAIQIPTDRNSFKAPLINPGKIVAVGLNYHTHANESNMELPKSPLVFAKFPSSIIGPTDTVRINQEITKEPDYEVELAVIIGKEVKNISKENALDYVFGYSVLNDISARDIQFTEGQWVRSKSIDTFCPLGPFIVTSDEISDPQNLKLGCKLNNKIMQEDNTKNMVFGVADLISILSRSFKFEPGDIIATGTPGGVGFSRKPPVFLKDSDVICSWIEGIGELLNPVSFI